MEDSRLLHLKTFDDMAVVLKDKGRGLKSFKKGDTIKVWNRMEKNYSYVLSENPGEGLAFKPHLNPGEILALGAFGGKYINDCLLEFPAEWFWHAGLLGKLSPSGGDSSSKGQALSTTSFRGGDHSLNHFQIDSRLPLSEWKKYGWVPGMPSGKKLTGVRSVLSDPAKNPDERGWFQWYCRYWMGRRIPELDAVQIQRWKNFSRHYGAVTKNCAKGDLTCRPRQRQALLHWAWPFSD